MHMYLRKYTWLNHSSLYCIPACQPLALYQQRHRYYFPVLSHFSVGTGLLSQILGSSLAGGTSTVIQGVEQSFVIPVSVNESRCGNWTTYVGPVHNTLLLYV